MYGFRVRGTCGWCTGDVCVCEWPWVVYGCLDGARGLYGCPSGMWVSGWVVWCEYGREQGQRAGEDKHIDESMDDEGKGKCEG